MTIFPVSFNHARNATCTDRLDNMTAELQSAPRWMAPGTVVVVDAPEPIDRFCDRLFQPRNFDEEIDIAVVFDLLGAECRSKGGIGDHGLFGIVPWMKRL